MLLSVIIVFLILKLAYQRSFFCSHFVIVVIVVVIVVIIIVVVIVVYIVVVSNVCHQIHCGRQKSKKTEKVVRILTATVPWTALTICPAI